MLTKEDFENLINETRDKLDDKSKALVSEDMLGIMGNYNSLLTTLNDRNQELEKLKNENDELLKVNGRLFQKIGFDKKEEKETLPLETKVEEKIGIDNLINEKGELI
jgi:hypothetical protein